MWELERNNNISKVLMEILFQVRNKYISLQRIIITNQQFVLLLIKIFESVTLPAQTLNQLQCSQTTEKRYCKYFSPFYSVWEKFMEFLMKEGSVVFYKWTFYSSNTAMSHLELSVWVCLLVGLLKFWHKLRIY